MKKNLMTLVAGVSFVVGFSGLGYVGNQIVKYYEFEKKEKIVLGVSLASLTALGYCLNEAYKVKK